MLILSNDKNLTSLRCQNIVFFFVSFYIKELSTSFVYPIYLQTRITLKMHPEADGPLRAVCIKYKTFFYWWINHFWYTVQWPRKSHTHTRTRSGAVIKRSMTTSTTNKTFVALRAHIPNLPPDTNLSIIRTMTLAHATTSFQWSLEESDQKISPCDFDPD